MRAWPVGLIGSLSPLLCAGLWSWGTYQPTEKGFSGHFQSPSEQVHQVVLCTAWYACVHFYLAIQSTLLAPRTHHPPGLGEPRGSHRVWIEGMVSHCFGRRVTMDLDALVAVYSRDPYGSVQFRLMDWLLLFASSRLSVVTFKWCFGYERKRLVWLSYSDRKTFSDKDWW